MDFVMILLGAIGGSVAGWFANRRWGKPEDGPPPPPPPKAKRMDGPSPPPPPKQ